jgi:Aldehyde dehydrogenase family
LDTANAFDRADTYVKLCLAAQMFYKACRVDYVPVGVVGAIVPWNYPFHNVFNPLLAAVFAGNACVIKASEHAAWSARYYQAVIDAALEAAGAPPGLVQIITGALASCRLCRTFSHHLLRMCQGHRTSGRGALGPAGLRAARCREQRRRIACLRHSHYIAACGVFEPSDRTAQFIMTAQSTPLK